MSPMKHFSCMVLTAVLLTIPTAVRADERPAAKQSEQEFLASLRESTRQLIREMEQLQDDIITELSGRKERQLYQKADAVLAVVVRFESALTPEVKREVLYKSFDEMDGRLHELLQAVRELGPEQRLLQRSAARIRALDEQIHYALFTGNNAEDRLKQLLERQARALAGAAQDLERTAKYALADAPGKGSMQGELHQLAKAAERLHQDLEQGASREQLKRDFNAFNDAWVKVVHGMKDLPPGQNVYLLRSASQVDRLHDRLFRMLGIEGKRPQLILRT